MPKPAAEFMRAALEQAACAQDSGEVPVGAVVVREGQVIGVGHNQPVAKHDPSAHAEIVALRQAAQTMGNYRLDGCEIYVTLEPCAMCAGAILHARVGRVVYGAPDPKAGAAGSVLNLFDSPLNHQTQVHSGVLADECGAVLSHFFRSRRAAQRQAHMPIRDDALRTPESRFQDLPDYPWPAEHVANLPSLAGLRMHYVDTGPKDAQRVWLCLHGNPAWSYVYRHMIPVLSASGDRVLAPDLIGFGKSDKPKRESAHRFTWHRQVLLEWVEQMDLRNIVLVVQDWGGLLGLTLPMSMPERFDGLLVMNTMLGCADAPLSPGFLAWREMCARKPEFEIGRLFGRAVSSLSELERGAYDAPFPDRGYRAALRAFPAMVPEHAQDEGAAISQAAREFWRERWGGRSLMAIGLQDPVFGEEAMRDLHANLRGCAEPLLLPQAGHFVPEHGAELAAAAVRYFSAP